MTGHRGKQAGHDLSKMSAPRNSAQWYAQRIEQRLKLTDDQPDYIDDRLDVAFGRIQVNLYSLFFDILAYTENTGDVNEKWLIDKCADIGANAMMIADQVQRKQFKEK